jgi:hypothetical protein
MCMTSGITKRGSDGQTAPTLTLMTIGYHSGNLVLDNNSR